MNVGSRNSIQVIHGVAGTLALGPSAAAFPHTLAGSWVEAEQIRLELALRYWLWESQATACPTVYNFHPCATFESP